LYQEGCTVIFSKIAKSVCKHEKVDVSKVHTNTTTFTVTGEEYESTDESAIKVTYGYSKDHRPDLKQVIQELLVTLDRGIPLISESLSCNKSDNKTFAERSLALSKSLNEEEWEGIIVGDCKLYSSSNAENLKELKIVTRIPHTVIEVKELIEKAELPWQEVGQRFYKSYEVSHNDINQRWLVVYSEESKKRAKETMSRRVSRELGGINKELVHLKARRFHCKQDAYDALARVEKKWKYHKSVSEESKVIEHRRFEKAGKPALEKQPDRIEYQISTAVIEDPQRIAAEEKQSACYVLGN
jgi:transposase